ncbi:MAG: enterobactin synthetase component D [Alteromonadaceae bacterium]
MPFNINDFITNQQRFTQVANEEVFIHLCDFNVTAYNDDFFRQLGIEFPASLDRAVTKRRAEYLAGRSCAKTALAGLEISDFTINAGKNRCPVWPQGVFGSITHSHNSALAVVTRKPQVMGLGIDIENVISAKTMADVADSILFNDDFAWLDLPGTNRETLFSLIFSIKESFFKAAYPSTGYYFDFDAVRVTGLDINQGSFELQLCQELNPKLTKGMMFSGQCCFVGEQVLSFLLIEPTAP